MADFGGVMRLTINGQKIKIRGKFSIKPTNFSYAIENNQDGTKDRIATPDGPMAEVDFVDSQDGSAVSQPWDALMSLNGAAITILEDTNGVIHQFSPARFTGKPDIDRFKGQVTGIQIHADNGGYTQLTA